MASSKADQDLGHFTNALVTLIVDPGLFSTEPGTCDTPAKDPSLTRSPFLDGHQDLGRFPVRLRTLIICLVIMLDAQSAPGTWHAW